MTVFWDNNRLNSPPITLHYILCDIKLCYIRLYSIKNIATYIALLSTKYENVFKSS